MHKQIVAIRKEKQFRLRSDRYQIRIKDVFNNNTITALSSKLRDGKTPCLLAEIHDGAQYNGTGFTKPIEELVALYDRYADATVIVTDDVLFAGDPEWIHVVRSYTNKPLVVLDIILSTAQLDFYSASGANVVILIVSLLSETELGQLRNHARQLGIEVILEVQDELELECALRNEPDIISINSRDITNLVRVDLEKVRRLSSLIPPGISVIAASGMETVHDIIRCGERCDGVLIGSSILRSRDMESSLRYFKELNDDLPFVWVRPPVFLFNRVQKLTAHLEEKGFSLSHSAVLNSTPEIYRKLYMDVLMKAPREGLMYYSVLAEMLKQVELRGGNVRYSEVWFLNHSHETLLKAYQALTEMKIEMRRKENIPVTTVRIHGNTWPVFMHSIHVPDPSYYAHARDLAVLAETRADEVGIVEYIEKRLYRKESWYQNR